MSRRSLLALCVAVCLGLGGLSRAHGQTAQTMLSIASGNTGGVYYPIAGGLANLLTRHVPGYQVSAEVTGGSIDNLRLVGSGRADVGFSMADAAWDAYQGLDKFKDKPQRVHTLAVLYPNRMHAVTVEATGIANMAGLKGKRVSVGSPGGATELMALRLLDAYGLSNEVRKERLSVNESVNALKDRKIDAFFWVGGVPTAAVTDLAATPGTKLRLLDHAEGVERMNARYGPLYVANRIAAGSYPGLERETRIALVWNILFVAQTMPDETAYQIVKTLFERKADLARVHKEAEQIALEYQKRNASPIPFHPGAVRFFAEKGIKLN